MNDKSTLYQWSKLYDFPPFFTIQPNKETLNKQIKHWCELVLNHFKNTPIRSSTIDELLTMPNLFHNSKIDRKLPREGIELILNELHKNGHLEWLDDSHQLFLLMPTKPAEIASNLIKYINQYFPSGTIVTLYELANDATYSKEMFYRCDLVLLKKAATILHNSNIVVCFTDNKGNVGLKVV